MHTWETLFSSADMSYLPPGIQVMTYLTSETQSTATTKRMPVNMAELLTKWHHNIQMPIMMVFNVSMYVWGCYFMFYNSLHKKYWILRDGGWKTYLCFHGKPCKNVRCVAMCLAGSAQPSDPPPVTNTAASRMHGPSRRHRVSLQLSPMAGREGSWDTRISRQQLVLWQLIPWNWEHVRFTLLEQCL